MGSIAVLLCAVAAGPSPFERWTGFPLTCEACRPSGGWIPCATCQGKGGLVDVCQICEGNGQRPCRRCTANRPEDWPASVPAGMVPCSWCRGSGRMRKLVHGAGAPAASWFEDRPCEFCGKSCGWVNCKLCHGKGTETCRRTVGKPYPCGACGGAGRTACRACLRRVLGAIAARVRAFWIDLLAPPPVAPPAVILEGEASAGLLLPPPQ